VVASRRTKWSIPSHSLALRVEGCAHRSYVMLTGDVLNQRRRCRVRMPYNLDASGCPTTTHPPKRLPERTVTSPHAINPVVGASYSREAERRLLPEDVLSLPWLTGPRQRSEIEIHRGDYARELSNSALPPCSLPSRVQPREGTLADGMSL
jgi:hypothetical protein